MQGTGSNLQLWGVTRDHLSSGGKKISRGWIVRFAESSGKLHQQSVVYLLKNRINKVSNEKK